MRGSSRDAMSLARFDEVWNVVPGKRVPSWQSKEPIFSWETCKSTSFSGIVTMHNMDSSGLALLQNELKTRNGTWYTDLIGPFTSHGDAGLSLAWTEAAVPSYVISRDLIGITGHILSAVDGNGIPLTYPPIHHHHFKTNIGPYNTRFSNRAGIPCLRHGTCLGDKSIFAVASGDEHCYSNDGNGLDMCLGENYSPQYKLMKLPLSVDTYIEDVRPTPTSPLTFWVQVSLRAINVTAVEAGQAISIHLLTNQFNSTFQTLPILTNSDSFFMYTGRMPISGRLIPALVKFHGHMVGTQEAFLFSGRSSDLNLPYAATSYTYRCSALTPKQVGFSSNAHLRDHLFSRADMVTSLICHAGGNHAEVDGVWYDRQARTACRNWSFTRGDIFTDLSLVGPTVQTARSTPSVIGEHTYWFLSYFAETGLSHFTSQDYSNVLDEQGPVTSRLEWSMAHVYYPLMDSILGRSTISCVPYSTGRLQNIAIHFLLAVTVPYLPLCIALVLLSFTYSAYLCWHCARRHSCRAWCYFLCLFFMQTTFIMALYYVWFVLPLVDQYMGNPVDAGVIVQDNHRNMRYVVSVVAIGGSAWLYRSVSRAFTSYGNGVSKLV